MAANTPVDAVLDDARRALGLTWEQVAERAGISPQALRKIRTGDSYPRGETQQNLEDALGLPRWTLLARLKPPGWSGEPEVTVMTDVNLIVIRVKTELHADDARRLQGVLQAAADAYCEGTY